VLYARLIARLGAAPTLLERDNDIPALPVLLAEAGRAESMMPATKPVTLPPAARAPHEVCT
jgi:uncharacterized protein (UPF0276 family)